MGFLDVGVVVFTVSIISYCGYQYFKEEAELPKYQHDVAKSDEHSTKIARVKA